MNTIFSLLRVFPSVVWDINFLKLWLAQFTSQIGLNALYFILTLQVYEVTKSNTAVSILILTFTIPSIVLGYIAGVYVDQFSLKKVMIVTNLLRALAVIFLVFFLNQTLLLFLIVLILAVATVFFIPAEGSAIPSIVPEKHLAAANALFSLTLQLSLVIGFLVGGFSLKVLGLDETVFAICGLFIISLLLNLLLPKFIRSENKVEEASVLRRFIRGIIFVFSTKKVRDAIFFLTLTTTIVFIIAAIGPGYVDQVLGQDVEDVASLVVIPATLGMAVGSFILSHVADRFSQRRLINIGLFGLAVTFLLLSLVGRTRYDLANHVTSLCLLFLLGLENALITIPTTTDFQRNTPENLRGRAYGLLGSFISGVAALPVLVAGAIGDIYGVRVVLVALGLLVTAFGIYRLRPRKV